MCPNAVFQVLLTVIVVAFLCFIILAKLKG